MGDRRTTFEAQGTLTGQVALVTGGSGIIGSAIVRQYLKEGAQVIAPVRSEEGRESLLAEVGWLGKQTLDIRICDVTKEEECAELAQAIKDKHGELDQVVSCIGRWWQEGPLTEQTLEEFNAVVKQNAAGHFVLAKNMLPLVRDDPQSCYLFVSGRTGERCYFPASSLMTMSTACLYGIVQASMTEMRASTARVCELRISALVRRNGHECLKGAPRGCATFGDPPRDLVAWNHRLVGRVAADVAATKDGDRIVRLGGDEGDIRLQDILPC